MTPHVGVLVVTDGRHDYLRQMVSSLVLSGQVAYGPLVVVDDSGDPTNWHRVDALFADFSPTLRPIHVRHLKRQGLASSVDSGWRTMLAHTDVEFVFHAEDDWTYPAPPPVADMVNVLDLDRSLAQIVLKRQAWSPAEVVAGGIIEMAPDEYEAQSFENVNGHVSQWVRHTRTFSLNPCLYRREVMAYGWHGHDDEGMFTDRLRADGWRFAFYGNRHDGPRCLHIGVRRTAQWTL